jgi:methyltransferase (TIGR00027 family)
MPKNWASGRVRVWIVTNDRVLDQRWRGASLTALGLAAARAVESSREDRLVDDPFARVLFEAGGLELPMRLQWPQPGQEVSDAEALHLHGSRYIGVRTRFYDDALTGAAGAGIRQCVIVGAGLDTRAFRLELPPDLRLWELDRRDVLEFKDEVLAEVGGTARCRRYALAVDLRDDVGAALRAAGFDRSRPVLWIGEGVLPYLPPDGQLELIGEMADSSAPGSRLVLDRVLGDAVADGRAKALTERSGIDMQSLLAGGDAPDPGDILVSRGWEVRRARPVELAARYGRDLSDPLGGGAPVAGREPWLATEFLSGVRLPAPGM